MINVYSNHPVEVPTAGHLVNLFFDGFHRGATLVLDDAGTLVAKTHWGEIYQLDDEALEAVGLAKAVRQFSEYTEEEKALIVKNRR